MKLPKENLRSYNDSRMANFVTNIPKHNKQYLLVHGTTDDNVHFQQSMILSKVLERADIQFTEIVSISMLFIFVAIAQIYIFFVTDLSRRGSFVGWCSSTFISLTRKILQKLF